MTSEITKDDVCNWETEATFYAEGDGLGPYLVEVQIGEAGGLWFGRTTDDAGGSDDAPDDPVGTDEAGAKEWSESFAEEMDEYPDEDSLAEEIAKSDWWAVAMTTDEILGIAAAATDRQSGSRLWVSDHGGTHWDTGNTLRVEGWEKCVIIGASHACRAAALNALQQAVGEGDEEWPADRHEK